MLSAGAALAGLDVVVFSGDDSPDGNGQLSLLNAPSINGAGQLAFIAQLTETAGGTADNVALYRRDATGLVLIARRGGTFNGMPINTFFPLSMYIDTDGTVAGVVVLGPPNVFLNFYGSGGPMTLMVEPGSPSPSGNNTLLGITTTVINDAGVAVYQAAYSGANPEVGLYERVAGGTVTTRVLRNSAAPRGGIINGFGNRPVLNESGQIGSIFSIQIDDSFVDSASRVDGTMVRELVREGDLALDGMTTITEISNTGSSGSTPVAMLNNAGQLAFPARYVQPNLGLGVFLADDSGATLIAPNFLPGGGGSPNTIQVFGLSDSGTAGFKVDFFGGADPLSGIYVADTSGPTLVAIEDAATPVPGKFFRSFFNSAATMNSADQIAFLAELSDTANGPAAGRGLYFHDSTGGLQEIARTGDMLAGSTITNLFYWGTQLAQAFLSPDTSLTGLNSRGQVAFAFTLASGQDGIAIWTDSLLAGDYNQNGTVDAADYTTWRDHLGQSFTLTNENPAAMTPGLVDAEDYAFWKAHFGQTAGSGSASAFHLRPSSFDSTVPEPTIWPWTVAAAVAVDCRRRQAGTRRRPVPPRELDRVRRRTSKCRPQPADSSCSR